MDVECGGPLLGGEIEQAPIDGAARGMDQHIDGAQVLRDFANAALDFFRFRAISEDELAASASGFDFLAGLGRFGVVVASVDGEVGALVGEVDGGGSADAFSATGDEADFVLEVHGACLTGGWSFTVSFDRLQFENTMKREPSNRESNHETDRAVETFNCRPQGGEREWHGGRDGESGPSHHCGIGGYEAPLRGRVTRRRFIQSTGAMLAAGAVVTNSAGQVSPGETLRVGLVGCGGRGTGAAAQAMQADLNVKLVAMGDAFSDRLEGSLATLQKQENIAEKIEVPKENRFVGFDAYQQVIGSGVDVVLLATPPHFRPIHLKAAIDAGKHVFAEKPVAVDAGGVRSVLATCEEAKRQKLSVVSGLCLRYSHGFQEVISRIHDGALGEVLALQANDFRGPIWVKPRKEGMTDMEYHMRNWYYFTWLSGDFNVEQHVHYLDVCSWVMNNRYPVKAVGLGGRQVRTGAEFGNIYDHHSVIYEFENGAKLFSNCCQQANCRNDMSVQVMGEKGVAHISERRLRMETAEPWVYRGEKNNIYQTEHDEFFAGIRKGEPINNGEYMAKSTLLAIMGRMATYTGKEITWEAALASKEDLSPDGYGWGANPPKSPIALPGVTPFV